MPEINLEDFERKLRAAGAGQGGFEDPLEELTRLVNTIANERPRDERVVDFSAARPNPRPATPSAPLLQVNPADDAPEFAPPPPELFQAAPRSLPASREDAPPLETPLLRPTFDEAADTEAEVPLEEAHDGEAEAGYAPALEPVVATRSRAPSWYWKVGGLVACAIVAAPVAYMLKGGGVGTGPKAPPVILAAQGPNKVAPPDEKTVQSASDTGALLNKDSTNSGPVKVVVNQEQPSDMALKGDSPVAPTKDSPIIAPNQSPMIVAPGVANAPPAAPAVSQGRTPKTVSVRPDGTVIVAGAAPLAATASTPPTPAPRKPEAAPSVTTQSASPTLDLPPPKAPKSSQRVAVGKTDTTAPTEPVSAPLQLGSAASEKPAKLPTKLSPPQHGADAQATGAAPAAPTTSGGEWAVQLAAPRSDADAQSAIQRLQTKYGSALGDTELGVKKAEVNGETIYRVRASGLSKADASALCQKLKADGGDCFVARN